MKISFIVPAYNAETTLESCVLSLLAQGLDPACFEIIIVNDGSTDGTHDLCRYLADHYQAIHVINQKNQGPSFARNSGIRAAHGDYICFVDSDDNLISNGIVSLMPYCDENYDIIRYWCELVYPGANAPVDMGDGQITFIGSGRDYLRQYGLETFCTNYLYKRSFIKENNLCFMPGILGEDFSFIFDVLMANPRVVSVAKRLYRHNIHPNSLSSPLTPEHSRRCVKDLMASMTRISKIIKPLGESDPLLFESCHCSLEEKTLSLLSRILSANYSTKEYKEILSSCHSAGLLPLQNRANTTIRLLIRFPFLYPAASLLFRRLFLPYFYPIINRNGRK
jgi:glycosyltransferase involved in cell wall biosynthesis